MVVFFVCGHVDDYIDLVFPSAGRLMMRIGDCVYMYMYVMKEQVMQLETRERTMGGGGKLRELSGTPEQTLKYPEIAATSFCT